MSQRHDGERQAGEQCALLSPGPGDSAVAMNVPSVPMCVCVTCGMLRLLTMAMCQWSGREHTFAPSFAGGCGWVVTAEEWDVISLCWKV